MTKCSYASNFSISLSYSEILRSFSEQLSDLLATLGVDAKVVDMRL